MSLFKKRKTDAEIEVERRIAYQKMVNKLNLFIENYRRLSEKYWEAGKKAAKLGDERMLRQFAMGYANMQENIRKAQKLLLFIENIYLKREEAKFAVEMVHLMDDLAGDLNKSVGVPEITSVEKNLAMALEKGEKTDMSLATVMDQLTNVIMSSSGSSEEEVSKVYDSMTEEALMDEKKIDDKIEERIEEIEKRMRGA